MLIVLLLVLSAIKVNTESVDLDGLRRSRQLDLGLQDIRIADEEIPSKIGSLHKDDKILPPVPSSLSPEKTSTQNQETFDFKLVPSKKGTELSELKIPTPSSDLVPPFNDLEQDLANKAAASTEETKKAVENQKKFVTTTEKLIFKQTPTENIRIGKASIKPTAELNNAEATNELRSYLPPQPEFSAAAQTNVAVVQPANQNNDHDHHHGHHHGDNFDICADAFHSFLCAPLKARKRITGAFPSNLRGQSSFINYQKLLPNFDRETAPSNTFRNEYLPPKPASTNLIQSTYLPPLTTRRPTTTSTTTRRPTTTTTTRRITTTTTTTTPRPYSPPKIIPEPSNSNEGVYLPPLTDNRIFSSPSLNPAPSIQAFSTVKGTTSPFPTTISPVPSVSSSLFQNSYSITPTIPIYNSLSSTENAFYLPPNPSPQPAASFVSTSSSIFTPTSTQQPSNFVSLPVVTSIEYLPPNSPFSSQSANVQPTFSIFTTTARPAPSPITTTFKPLLQFSSFASQPSNPSNSYLPPASQFQSSPKPTTTTPKPSIPKLIPQPSNAGREYLPPDPREPAAAQISSAAVAPPQVKNPFHHGRDLCTDPFHSFLCSSAKPRKRITGQLPPGFKPESSNRKELRLKPEPSTLDESKLPPEKPLEGASAQNVGYKYPKPINPLPTPSNAIISSTLSPSTGYSYPKPDKIFPLPSQQDVKIAPVTTSTRKNPETTLRPSEAKNVGYQYPKPDKILPLPGRQQSTTLASTTNPTTTGYSYPKPQKPFPLPTEQKEVQQKPPQAPVPFPTNQVVGYQYPKPDKTFSLPGKPESTKVITTTNPPATGYSYPKPQKPFPLSTEQKVQVTGYQYPKPEQSLKLPEKKGYSYPKPEKRLELPSEEGSKHLLPQANSNLDALRNLGSAEFIPVNKLEFKRSESSKLITGLRRFGERMKKREKQAQLSKRQLH